MRKLVLLSGGFHPFHAGHAALYQAARSAFPDARVVVGATDVQTKRPFPFKIKQALAQIAGVPPEDFVQVQRQFSATDPSVAEIVGDRANETALIFVRSQKDQGQSPMPPARDAQGNLPLVTRGPRKGQPVSDYLAYYPGTDQPLEPMTQHAYMAYLPVAEFGGGMTSATEIRNTWPTLDQQQKSQLVNDMYPRTVNNKKLTDMAVKLIDKGLGIDHVMQESPWQGILPHVKSAVNEFKSGNSHKLQQFLREWKLLENKISQLEKLYTNQQDYITEKK